MLFNPMIYRYITNVQLWKQEFEQKLEINCLCFIRLVFCANELVVATVE